MGVLVSGCKEVARSQECLLSATPVVRVFADVSNICLAKVIFCFVVAMTLPHSWRALGCRSSGTDCRIGSKS